MTAPTIPPSTDRAAVSTPRAAKGPPSAAPVRLRVRALIALRARTARWRGDGPRPGWFVAPVAAAWAALIGLAVVSLPLLLMWMATPQSGLTWLESLRVAGLLWIVAHGTPIVVGGTVFSLLPWGLALVPVLLLGYAGGWAARRTAAASVREVARLVALAAVTYALIALGLSHVTAAASAAVTPAAAFVAAGLMAVVAFGWGAVRSSALDVPGLAPGWLTLIIRGGVIGAMAMVGLGAVAAMASLLVHLDDAITMAQSLHAGIGGGFGLLLAGLLYVPVMAVWAAAYLVGAGVVIGPAVVVSPFIPVTAPTQLPPFPLLAALPQSASPLAWALPMAGVLAGVVVGLAIARHARQEPRLFRLAVSTCSAAAAGVIMMLASYLASGSLGDLRLAHLGPSPVAVGVLTGLLITLGAVPSAVAARAPDRPNLLVASVDTDADADGDAE